jgi:hypothetical protein
LSTHWWWRLSELNELPYPESNQVLSCRGGSPSWNDAAWSGLSHASETVRDECGALPK